MIDPAHAMHCFREGCTGTLPCGCACSCALCEESSLESFLLHARNPATPVHRNEIRGEAQMAIDAEYTAAIMRFNTREDPT